MYLPKILAFFLGLIGKRGFVLYLGCALALMLPSFTFWFRSDWTIMSHEFDFWNGYVPFFWKREAASWRFLGNILQSALFLGAGLGFWASVLELHKDLEKGIRVKIGAKIATVLIIFSLGIPWFSGDCFFYLAKGWLEANYGVDVFRVAITEIPGYSDDVFFKNIYVGFIGSTGSYGPLFQFVMKELVLLGGGNFKLTFLLLRCFFLGGVLASAWIVVRLAGRRGFPPALVAYLFLCSPLMAFNMVTSLHNDAISNLLVLLSLLCAWNRKAFWSGVFLGIGAAWKFIPLILFPPLTLYFLRRERMLTLGDSALFLAGLGLSFGGSFLLYPSAFDFFTAAAATGLGTFRASIAMFLTFFLVPFFEVPTGFMIVKKAMTLLFLVLSGVLLWPYLTGKRLMRQETMIFVCFLVFLLYILIGNCQVEEWYFTWLLGLAFILSEKRVIFFTLFLSVFYMPWVNFMNEQSDFAMAFSQAGACLMVVCLTAAVLVKPLLFSKEYREEMLGPKANSPAI